MPTTSARAGRSRTSGPGPSSLRHRSPWTPRASTTWPGRPTRAWLTPPTPRGGAAAGRAHPGGDRGRRWGPDRPAALPARGHRAVDQCPEPRLRLGLPGRAGRRALHDRVQQPGHGAAQRGHLHGRVGDRGAVPGAALPRPRDGDGRVIYVGKAKSLRKRLAAYWGRPQHPRTEAMLEAAGRVEWIVASGEVDALHLEYNLIQEHLPRFNVRYAPAYAIRETLDALTRVFPVRTCSNGFFPQRRRAGRPCLYYDIGRCAGPCVPEK